MASPFMKPASAAVAQLLGPGASLREPNAEFDARWATWLTTNRREHDRAVQWRLWVLMFGAVVLGMLAILAFRMNGGVA